MIPENLPFIFLGWSFSVTRFQFYIKTWVWQAWFIA